ncbi:MAG: hypothetical protein OTJ44_02660 [Planctomycetota bacterium]|nr:hypothetical protein [Planctomycetota bacterium]
MKNFSLWMRQGLQSLMETRCALCAMPMPWPTAPELCDACRQEWPTSGSNFCGSILAAGLYVGSLQTTVLRAKEEANSPLQSVLAQRLLTSIQKADLAPGCFVPIPPSFRRRLRAHSLPVALANHLSRSLHWPSVALLKNCRKTAPQASLQGRGRRRNRKNSMALQLFARKPVAPVWLVDDVCTTGATLAEAVRVFREHGIPCAGAVVAARVDASPNFLESSFLLPRLSA